MKFIEITTVVIVLTLSVQCSQKHESGSSSLCEDEINSINSSPSQSIMDNIRFVSANGEIPDTLTMFYPYARSYWNECLKIIEQNYGTTDDGTLMINFYQALDRDTAVIRKKMVIKKSYYFFLYLNKQRNRARPNGDQVVSIATIKQSDPAQRLFDMVSGIQSTCPTLSKVEMQKNLKFLLLPENISDCLAH